jgi:quercetin dioxygenase-like cupin family protein
MHAVGETLRRHLSDNASRDFENTNVFHDADLVKGRRVILTKSIRRLRFGRVPVFCVFSNLSMATTPSVTWYRWADIPREAVSPLLDRRLITGDRMMLAHVYLKKGCIVPKHSHENEQLTYILEGALRFWIGEDQKEEVIVRAGEVLHIPSHVPHKAEALEETCSVRHVRIGSTRPTPI